MRNRILLVLLTPLLFLAACATHHPAAASEAAAADTVDPRTFTLIDGRTGRPIDWSDLISRAAAADAVFLGETHAPGAGQAFHGPFFRDVLTAAPTAAAALEFYERDHQADLDDYLSGITDWSQLVKAAFTSSASDLAGHRAIVQACKASTRPAAAANAPRRYATLARREGFERLAALSAEQRRLFDLPSVTPSARYRSDFFNEMGVDLADAATNPDDVARVDATFRAQTLWDATMADSVSRLIDAGAHPAVLVVGRFHTDHDGGLIQQFRARRPAASILSISLNVFDPAPQAPVSPEATRLPSADIEVYAPRP